MQATSTPVEVDCKLCSQVEFHPIIQVILRMRLVS